MRWSVPAGLALTLVAVASIAVTTAAQKSTSAPVAKELAVALAQQKATVVAARDPDQAGFYVAASYIPGVQLLVVSARPLAPERLDQFLAAKRYDEAYASLNMASVPEGKLFVQDIRADGLAPGRDEGGSFDIVYQNVVKTFMFNGDWKKQGLTESQYRSIFEALDARYARMLSALLSQLQSGG